MIVKEWKYSSEPFHEADYDKFYCFVLHRMVDLGWSQWTNTNQLWVMYLNSIAADIYKTLGITSSEIQMNEKNFELLRIQGNEYYKDGKFGHYKLTISKDIEDNKINVLANKNIEGQIVIIK